MPSHAITSGQETGMAAAEVSELAPDTYRASTCRFYTATGRASSIAGPGLS